MRLGKVRLRVLHEQLAANNDGVNERSRANPPGGPQTNLVWRRNGLEAGPVSLRELAYSCGVDAVLY